MMIKHLLMLVVSWLSASLFTLRLAAAALLARLFRLALLFFLTASRLLSGATLLLLATSTTLGSALATGTGRGSVSVVAHCRSSMHRWGQGSMRSSGGWTLIELRVSMGTWMDRCSCMRSISSATWFRWVSS